MNEELTHLLSLEIPTHKPSEEGFLEISGISHYENVNSRIYAYFLDQNREKKLSDLFLSALLNVIYRKTDKRIKLQYFWSQTEVRTIVGNRIDVVLEDTENEAVILIENKIYHHLANDLNDYWNHYNKYPENQKIGVLLTLEPHPLEIEFQNRYINITHKEWIDEIKKIGLPAGISHKTYVYLNDFFNTIENLTKNLEMNELAKFYFKNTKQVLKAVETKSEAENFIISQIEQLAEKLGLQVFGKSAGWRNIWDQHNDRNVYYTIAYQGLLDGDFRIYVIIEMNGPLKNSQALIWEKIKEIEDVSNLNYKSWENSNFLHFLSKDYYPELKNIEELSEFLHKIITNKFQPIYLKILDIVDSHNL